MPKVSIIIPVYNVAQYVARCMESLRSQTMQDFEVLFVDDHGQDDSVSIIQKFISANGLNERWRVLETPKNNGPAVARNIGIPAARGEYIAFVDSDDWIEADMLEALYRNAKEYLADLSSCAAVLDFSDGTHRMMKNPYIGNGIVSKRQHRYLLQHYVSNFTTMLFRREWLLNNGILFPNAKSGEDSSFMGQCYLMAERIAQTDKPMYHYVIHPQSISHKRGVWRGGEKKKAFDALLRYAREHGVWHEYKLALRWVYFKKVIVTSIIDYIHSL